ncbi:TonB-dependent receptor plug domain-containing protein [Luteimonas terricola]|uniref:TonB-dependent receptor n=1 Tax=Luteimonas terricola TaxID=645597 RepID=A0ABQ2EKL3_9GAMM|nr:TonB-dependent receptor [Luteimonas terricola]GGK14809.1 TonB-dependent receptor [Luteimonas terricola]
MHHRLIKPTLLSVILASMLHSTAFAQQQDGVEPAQPQAEATAKDLDAVVVVGSRLASSRTEGPSPVVVMDEEKIEATGAISGDELLQAIPQVGDMMFSNTDTASNLNAARGDVGSINLRNLGTGNTLLMVNGRRMVPHPGTQTESLVPRQTANMNAIPLFGTRRIETLLGGASALYGSDAVAGVVNVILDTHYQGFQVQAQYGGSEDVDLRQGNINFKWGQWFNDGRTRATLVGGWTHRTDLPADARDYTANMDRRPLMEGTEFEGVTAFDDRISSSAWGAFQTVGNAAVRGPGGALITNGSGQFHIDPVGHHGCTAALDDGVCINSGAQSTASDRPLRFSPNHQRLIMGELDRMNAFGTLEHDLDDNFVAFGELAFYKARYHGMREQAAPLGAASILVSKDNYYNPFGAMYLPDGSLNPNRLAGIDAPEEGLDVRLASYRPTDTSRPYTVDDESYRFLTGVRGMVGGFDWEGALLYSSATTTDTQYGSISNTLFSEALSWSTPDAYNPFLGGNRDDWGAPADPARNQAAIDHFTVPVVRDSKATLFQLDTRFIREDLFQVPAGHVGVAFGGEWRRETLNDDRDPSFDGTLTYTNPMTGAITSDVLGASPSGDNSGDREVGSLYAEFAIPLVRALDLQVAGRYEHYSDFGGVAKPKVSLAWDIVDGMMFRANWSQSFLAPNILQMYSEGTTVSNTRTDYYVCEADIRKGTIDGVHRCGRSYSTMAIRSGNRDLQPETAETWSAGFVFQPRFLPESTRMTFTTDYFEIQQEDVIGILGEATHLALDYLLRMEGSFNPAVVRLEPDEERIALFEGTGLDPVGRVDYVDDLYINRLPRTTRGIDFGVDWRMATDTAGTFSASLNATRLIQMTQDSTDDEMRIIAAQEAGLIDDNFDIRNAGNLLGVNGKPQWRATFSGTWRKDGWGLGTFVNHIDGFESTGAVSNLGNYYPVPSWTTTNVWAERRFSGTDGFLDGLRVRLTVRNIGDRQPPLMPTALGFSSLHNALGRGYYLTVTKSFD